MVSVRIPLGSRKHPNQYAKVSIEDAERILAFKWSVDTSSTSKAPYAVRKVRDEGGKRRAIFMHQAIAGRGCDHRNRDGLDNRRSNLRPATRSQQSINRGIQSNNTSGYTGVHYNQRAGKWIAQIKRDKKQVRLGHFDSIEAAIAARREAEVDLFGDFRPTR